MQWQDPPILRHRGYSKNVLSCCHLMSTQATTTVSCYYVGFSMGSDPGQHTARCFGQSDVVYLEKKTRLSISQDPIISYERARPFIVIDRWLVICLPGASTAISTRGGPSAARSQPADGRVPPRVVNPATTNPATTRAVPSPLARKSISFLKCA